MRLNKVIDRLSGIRLWLLFFLYTFCVSALVQIVLLPYVFPGLHAGNGLLNCSFDSRGFYKVAVELADKIRTQGWSAWQLRPEGHAPAGIAALFYVFVLPDPRVLIPLNTALHASAALVLVNLLNLFVKSKSKAVLCALPFLIFPSNLQWTAQWHRDAFSILGIVLILQSMVSLSMLENYKVKNWFFVNFRSVIFCICSLFLIWLARPYMLMIIVPFVILFFSLLFLIFLIVPLRKGILWRRASSILLSILLILFGLMQILSAKFKESAVDTQVVAEKISIKNTEVNTLAIASIKNTEEIIKKDDIEEHWKGLSWLPLAIESKIYYLAQIRRGFRLSSLEARSNIDNDVGFGSVRDMLVYLPRAAQIAFLAPFPNQWLREGSYPATSLMRRISAYEMIVVYFSLLFLPYAIWYWRKRIEIWIISIFCVYMMLVHGLVVCNVGTLYRMRYVYITTLVTLGIAGFIAFLDSLKTKNRQARKIK